ncbi:MAG: phage holin family protein [Eubacteriales bacterium]|jgi:putative membrane protein
MNRLVLKIIANTFALYAATLVLPAAVLNGVWAGLLAGTVLTLLNILIRPFLLLITLPVNLITLGLFTLVINTWMVMLTDKIIPGVTIPGFWSALAAALLVTLANLLLNQWTRPGQGGI